MFAQLETLQRGVPADRNSSSTNEFIPGRHSRPPAASQLPYGSQDALEQLEKDKKTAEEKEKSKKKNRDYIDYEEVMFARYPYDFARNGLFRHAGEKGYYIKVSLTTQGHFQNKNKYGSFVEARFYPTRFIHFTFNHLQLLENQQRQQFTAGLINYSAIRRPDVHLWLGGGAVGLQSSDNSEGGLTYAVGVEWFVRKPLSLYSNVQMLWIDYKPTQIFQTRVQYYHNRLFVYSGYQGLLRQRVHSPSLVLGAGVYF